jgi:DNA-binding CsgD family transcriptional regulator
VSTTFTSVVVVHPERLAAEGIAAALERFRDLVPVGIATSGMDAERLGIRADAVVVHEGVPDGETCSRRLRSRGVRVVQLGEGSGNHCDVTVLPSAPLRSLAVAVRPEAAAPDGGIASLTVRERQVLALVTCGLAGKQVARRLGISPKTVERHKTRIFSKLGVANQAAAAGLAARHDYGWGEVKWIPSST